MLLEKSDLKHPAFRTLYDLVKIVFSPKYDREKIETMKPIMNLLLAITDFSEYFPWFFNVGNWFVVNLYVVRK